MSIQHDQFADWDGAYVMGALSRVERQQYEDHLACCGLCADSVAELSPLPGLLGRLSPEDAELLLAAVPAELPGDLAARTLVAAHAVAPRRRVPLRLGLVAAAAAAIAAVVVPVTLHATSHGPDETVQLAQTIASPLKAQVSLTAEGWGTRVDMSCQYAKSGYDGGQRPYALYVIDDTGHATLVSRWHAGPGDTSKTTGSTDLPLDQISQLQIRADDGTVLLAAKA